MKFNRIAKGTAAFDAAVKVFNESAGDRFDYDGMGAAYNETAVGDYLSFEYKKGKGGIVKQQFEKRGLKSGLDFEVRTSPGPEGSDTATILVQRISEKTAGAAQHAPRGRKPAAPGAPADASATAPAPAATDAKADANKGKK